MSTPVILLVEDNADDGELTLRALRAAEIASPVVWVQSGEEALDYLFARGAYSARSALQLPAVALLDIQLPGASGLDVLHAIRSHPATRHLPVVMLTGSVEECDRRLAYARFANSYVQKPVDFDRFLVAARHLGVYWTAMNEPPPGGE